MTLPPLGTDVLTWLGTDYKLLIGPEDTDGRLSMIDSVSPPDSGPPRHVHEAEDEAFFLMSGACEFWLEGDLFTRSAGESVFVPRGREHTFRVIGSEPCRHLVILTPGGFEGFFREMAMGQFRIPEDMPAVEESAARHNLRFTGPPLGV